MSVLNHLASALGIRSEVPNQQLASKIVAENDALAVKELVENLRNKKKEIQADCIKTLYEIGYKKPELISDYSAELINELDSKNPRMVWGSMTALSAIANEAPKEIYNALPKIMHIADTRGSVIARDHAMYILAQLAIHTAYYEDCYALIAEQLMKAPLNQFPMYAEVTYPVIKPKDKEAYKSILVDRLATIDLEPKRKRIQKVLKALDK